MQPAKTPVTVAILVFPETTASVVHGMYDLFASAGRDWGMIVHGQPGAPLMQPRLVSSRPGSVIVSNDVKVEAHQALEDCTRAEVVCIPEVNIAPGESLAGRFTSEISWLQQCHRDGSLLAAACSGAMLLAEAGLLDGQEATTHWAWHEALKRSYPAVKARVNRALVASGEGQRLIMAGGGTTWLDMALYVIARTVGVEAAMQVARVNLIDWHAIGQQPFARLAQSRQVEDAVIARCQRWIAEHYQTPAPVAAMTRLSGLAERSFKRRFSQATGMTPLEYVHTLRLEEAKQMLESGAAPVESIAHEVGYEDAGFFSRLFRRKVNLTPVQYRKRFGAMRRALQSGA